QREDLARFREIQTDELQHCPRGLNLQHCWAGCLRYALQLVAQPIKCLTVGRRDSGYQSRRRLGAVLPGPAILDLGRRSLAYQSFESAVGVRASEPRHPRNGVPCSLAVPKQHFVYQALGWGEAELGKVDASHISSIAYYRWPDNLKRSSSSSSGPLRSEQ